MWKMYFFDEEINAFACLLVKDSHFLQMIGEESDVHQSFFISVAYCFFQIKDIYNVSSVRCTNFNENREQEAKLHQVRWLFGLCVYQLNTAERNNTFL